MGTLDASNAQTLLYWRSKAQTSYRICIAAYVQDISSPGKRCGDLRLKFSDNNIALGYAPIPAGVIINGVGPTFFLTSNEFEGPMSLIKFLRDTSVDDVQG